MSGLEPVLIAAAGDELPPDRRVWGRENRSLPAAAREAVDWLALCRFLGWDIGVERGRLPTRPGEGRRCVIVTREPAELAEEEVAALEAALAAGPLLVVARAAPPGAPLARLAGASALGERTAAGEARWVGPGGPWRGSALSVPAHALGLADGCVPWAFAGGAPLVAARPVGRGIVTTLAAHPSEARDAGPAGTGLLKRLLVWGSPPPLAWLELERTLVVRIDDPGSSANVHLSGWQHAELTERAWLEVSDELGRRDARAGVCYVSGWIDDGDPERGELRVDGHTVEREPGAVHPSPAVSYRFERGELAGTVSDYGSEFRGIQALRAAGRGDVEVHGYTHVRPDPAGWAAAPDRYESDAWYRELEGFAGARSANGLDPVARGRELLGRLFGVEPTTLACPGQACSEAAVESALEAGLRLVAAESLAIRDGERFCWSDHVASPAIEYVDPSLLEAGLPVVGVLHDRDLALSGPEWIGERLDEWAASGARRLIDFRELAGALAVRVSLVEGGGAPVLEATSSGPELVRPVPVGFRSSDPAPSELGVRFGGLELSLPVDSLPAGGGTVILPAAGRSPSPRARA